eukprot:746229-Hanusia_phi.AAC.9
MYQGLGTCRSSSKREASPLQAVSYAVFVGAVPERLDSQGRAIVGECDSGDEERAALALQTQPEGLPKSCALYLLSWVKRAATRMRNASSASCCLPNDLSTPVLPLPPSCSSPLPSNALSLVLDPQGSVDGPDLRDEGPGAQRSACASLAELQEKIRSGAREGAVGEGGELEEDRGGGRRRSGDRLHGCCQEACVAQVRQPRHGTASQPASASTSFAGNAGKAGEK